jgi:hypothetical protein
VGCLTCRFPFRRSKDRNRFQTPVAEYLVASREVGCSSECYRHSSSRRIGLPAPIRNSLFPTARWFSPDAFPRPLRERVHPLVSFASPSECVLFVTCPTRVPSNLPGFRSHSRHEHMKSTWRRASHSSAKVRPQRFSRSRRFAPSHTL